MHRVDARTACEPAQHKVVAGLDHVQRLDADRPRATEDEYAPCHICRVAGNPVGEPPVGHVVNIAPVGLVLGDLAAQVSQTVTR
jgi:hypothetical protein